METRYWNCGARLITDADDRQNLSVTPPVALHSRYVVTITRGRYYTQVLIAHAVHSSETRLTQPQLFRRFTQSITYRLTHATRLVTKKTCPVRLSNEQKIDERAERGKCMTAK